jgi:hypothetical protein
MFAMFNQFLGEKKKLDNKFVVGAFMGYDH